MTYRDFCYWLQGFFEIADPKTLSPDELAIIKRHLDMVFIHERGEGVTAPKRPDRTPPGAVAMC